MFLASLLLKLENDKDLISTKFNSKNHEKEGTYQDYVYYIYDKIDDVDDYL